MYSFSKKIVMVTGAAGNLGRAVTAAFEAAGANLALVDRGEQRLRQAFPHIIDSPDHFLGNCADLTDPDAVEAVVSNTIERFARIDVLVNTVGGFRAGTALHETPLETWDFLLNLNARSVYIASRSVIPHMLKHRWGKIISLAARPGLQGRANMAAYSASKSAVIRLTESMAAELRDSGINVNCILPGTIDTPQNREAMPDADHSRWVKPEALADVILFLASDAARDVHGAALPVYGRS
jgi:NAD(P)-dependent dehydrogenase (short-subunit alcohol dehydrogenase family)